MGIEESRVGRREFIRATSAAVLLAGVPAGWSGGFYAAEAPQHPRMPSAVRSVSPQVSGS